MISHESSVSVFFLFYWAICFFVTFVDLKAKWCSLVLMFSISDKNRGVDVFYDKTTRISFSQFESTPRSMLEGSEVEELTANCESKSNNCNKQCFIILIVCLFFPPHICKTP